MDTVDAANQAIEHDLKISLARAHKTETDIIANGYCHTCGHPIPDNQRWCDADCRDEWIDEACHEPSRMGQLNGH